MNVAETLGRALADRYAIEREIGAGGMASVYLARDLRHDRKVALKVLRPELASILGGERFLAEIKTTANLQHPHILPLHDSGEAEGLVFYVMPYVEGESLRDRLLRDKLLPVDEAVRLATEVASALDYAHRHGVVHRDIKPENILLHEGQALVADFGIALAVHSAGAGTRMTETGISLGTPHYMAPEQAMGQKEITPQADVYALGCVLYEMLVGEPPFTGPTAQAIVARVLTEQPRALASQRHTIAPQVEAAVLRALEKLPADRPASAAQFAEALVNPAFAAAAAAMAPAARRRRDWRSLLAIPAVMVAVLATALAVWALARSRPSLVVRRFGLSFPASQAPLPDRRFVLSPDGAFLAYVGPSAGGGSQLWVKARDRYEAAPLAGTANVTNFTFSPDGQWIAYVQNLQLKKTPVIGGAAITLADSLSGNSGLAWLDDRTLVYIFRGSRELRRIRDVGGPSTMVWRSDTATVAQPAPLPGGRGVLFRRCLGGCGNEQDLWVLDLRSGVARRLLTDGMMGQYVPTGHVIYVRPDGAMLAVPFDVRSLEVRGTPVPVLDSVSIVGIGPMATVSSDGTLITRPGSASSSFSRYEMVWVDRAGRETRLDTAWTFRLTSYGTGNGGWALSPDGRRLAIGLATDAGDDIWIKQLPRGPLSRLTFDGSAEFRPRWMPDARYVMFVSARGGNLCLYRRRADGTGADELVLQPRRAIYEGVWSRDGRWLVIRWGGSLGGIGSRDILGLRPGTDSVPVPLVAAPNFDEAAVALSPDGRWLAYESNETGRSEVYVRPFPTTEAGKWQVSTGGGIAPIWAPGGRELFYVNGAREMVVTAVTTAARGPSPRLGGRRVLFRLRDELYVADGQYYTPFDVSPDGRQFIMARRVWSESGPGAPFVVVTNWFEELKQKMGGR